ncbi:unnamed protein product [Microthlaspi erraticum]|uniref:SWIM-type domain-containing protein n=1 Tax=Microthlaspi erraticum TaxID=1685480 RepID=A0A6D2KTC7_9BRAS|nr:unnamed protein product [Microthlaspi erraticum]
MEFQTLGIPCKHAIAAAGAAEMPTDSLFSAAYYGETWTLGFTGKIYPVPSVGGGEIGSTFRGELMPPLCKRPPGRPKKVRILSRGEYKKPKKSGKRCSRCHREVHNKASCKNPI